MLAVYRLVILLVCAFSYGECYFLSMPRTICPQLTSPRSQKRFLNAESGSDDFTRKQLLKEETESPFRKVRLFLSVGLGAAAGLGSLLNLISLLTITSGVKEGNIDEVIGNLAVNLGGIPVIAYVVKQDLDSQKSALTRIQKGGKLAGLKIKIDGDEGPLIVKLSDLRRGRGINKKVVIVAAPSDLLNKSLTSSFQESRNLRSNDLIVVPVAVNKKADGGFYLSSINVDELSAPDEGAKSHIGVPVAMGQWMEVMEKVREACYVSYSL